MSSGTTLKQQNKVIFLMHRQLDTFISAIGLHRDGVLIMGACSKVFVKRDGAFDRVLVVGYRWWGTLVMGYNGRVLVVLLLYSSL